MNGSTVISKSALFWGDLDQHHSASQTPMNP